MAVESGLATPQRLLWRRVREKILVWQRLFSLNWNLFKASRIGVVGLAIMVAFLLIALAAPFMGLRDPIRWTAPDEDLIELSVYWEISSAQGGTELAIAPPITQGLSFRVLPTRIEPQTDRVYVPAGDRLYAFVTSDEVLPNGERLVVSENAWQPRGNVNVSRIDGVGRTISTSPLVMNYGGFVTEPTDFEIYVGTSDGTFVIVRDNARAVSQPPAAEPHIRLFGRITGMAAYNHDMEELERIVGRANYLTYSNTSFNWEYREIPGAVLQDEGEFTSLALNTTGNRPLVASYDLGRGIPKVGTLVNGAWTFLTDPREGGGGVEPFNPNTVVNTGWYTSLAMGNDSVPRLAYYNQTSYSLRFARWAGNAWNRTTVDTNATAYVSLALNATNGAHLAYYDEVGRRLMYAFGDGSTWTREVADESPGQDVGRFASLALDGVGGSHVAYYDAAGALKYAHRAGSGLWTNETVVAGGGEHASLALHPTTDLPAISYYDAATRSLGYVEQLVPGAWTLPVSVDDPPNAAVGNHSSLAFDPAGNPAIAYQDATHFDLKFANRTGSWRTTTLRSEGHTGFNNSLEFDSQGNPHIAFYSFVTQRSSEDLVVVGTETGHVYAIDVSIPDAISRGNREKQVTSWDYRVRWNTTLGSEVHVAAAPLRKPAGAPLFSPAFNETGAVVFLGTEDGRLIALNTSDGGNYWWNATQQFVPMGSPWHTAPVVYPAASGPQAGTEIVYAATGFIDSPDVDSSPESLLVARHATTGTSLEDWGCQFPGYDGGAFMGPTLSTSDGGNLTQPVIDADIIYVASDSGRLYAIRRDGIGDCGNWNIPPASQKWMYRDLTLLGLDGKFTSPPVVFTDSLVLLAAGSHNNGTASNPSDDKGILYSLRVDQGNVSWKRTLPSPVAGLLQIWREENSAALHPAVWATYGGGGGRTSGVISLSVVGLFLAPSEPSWAHEYKCGTSADPDRVCSGYPSGNQYWLGLDSQGRDIFSQLIWGSRIALLVGFLSALFTVLVGVIVGLIAGYVGGKTESILMRFTDVILVLPGLPLIITLAAVLGASIWNIILVISLLGWPGVARIIRAEVLSLKERPFIDSARVSGASTTRIVFRHIAPNVMPLAFLYMTFSVSGAILTEAALSFIGLGDIATMSWGIMLQLVSQSDALRAWWWLLPPGLAITLISLAFFLVGRAFDEIVNPRLRKR